MRAKFFAVTACCVIAFGAAMPARAHHSFAAEYDMKKAIEVHGTIVEVRLENPHSFFVLDVKDPAGKLQRWYFEAGTPSGMIRNGYRKDAIKPGDQVTIKGFAAKDADTRGMLRQLIMSDGRVYGLFGPQENRPEGQ
jgi:DNA/RNA endonuclease YhcR with UshA esterase domain